MSAGALIPCRGIVKAEWTPTVQQAAPETLSGESDVIELGRSYWALDFEVELSRRSYFDEWAVFLAERDGADLSFTSPRHFRKYPADPLAFSDGSLTLIGVDQSARTVSFGGVGTNIATRGDMISYRTAGNGYWVGMVRYDAIPAGGTVTMPVWPAPVAPHPTTPTPRRIEALGEFKIDGDVRWGERAHRRTISFKAKQVLR